MAELFMECEEEELEPWQQKAKPIVVDDDDDDDEPIFVGEILSSKPTNTYILNRVSPSSPRIGMQNGVPKRGAVAVSPGFRSATRPAASTLAVQPQPRASNVPGASQALQRPLSACSSPQETAKSSAGAPLPVSRSATSSRNLSIPALTQAASRPVATVTAQPAALNRVPPNNTSGVAYSLRQDVGGSQCQSGSAVNTAGLSKRPSTSEASSITPKKAKANETRSGSASPVSPSVKSPSETSSVQKGITSSNVKNGAPFPQACPKCNIHFNLLEPLKNHIKYCCPDMVHNFLGTAKTCSLGTTSKAAEAEKGKLIMLVNDFYYGKHEGNVQQVRQEQKTHTTFKCASCMKLLKSNIRFMNHMKHHLELEKQNSESWESHTTCQHCYRQFPTPFQLQCHIESTHTPHESSTVCKICELSFESEQVLLQHMKDNHKPGEMPYVCQVCNYRSSAFADVEKHFRAIHENTKSLLCPFCLKVIKLGAPYMHHFMRHQKKGVHRCAKCRLQFLTCKEKMEHKSQHHRTFKKPAQLEGLPPGTKVTIRASVGSLHPASAAASSVSPNASTLQLSPNAKVTNTKTPSKPNANKAKSKLKPLSLQRKPSLGTGSSSSSTSSTSSKKNSKIANTALNNLRCPDIQKCIECYSDIRTFASHFPAYVRCSLCRYSTSCSKAYVNHMMSFHSARQSKRFWIYKAHSEELRGFTVVCLNCDFLTDVSGLDKMATHLIENHTHTCQVIIENVPVDYLAADDPSNLVNHASLDNTTEEKDQNPSRPSSPSKQNAESPSLSPQVKDSTKETGRNNVGNQSDDTALTSEREETKLPILQNSFGPELWACVDNPVESTETEKAEDRGSQHEEGPLVIAGEEKKPLVLENICDLEFRASSESSAEEGNVDSLGNQTDQEFLSAECEGNACVSTVEDSSISEGHTYLKDSAGENKDDLENQDKEGPLTAVCEGSTPGVDKPACVELSACSNDPTKWGDTDCHTGQGDACPTAAKYEGNILFSRPEDPAVEGSACSNDSTEPAEEAEGVKRENEENKAASSAKHEASVSVPAGGEPSMSELGDHSKDSPKEMRNHHGNQSDEGEGNTSVTTVKNSKPELQDGSVVASYGRTESDDQVEEKSSKSVRKETNSLPSSEDAASDTKEADLDEAQLSEVDPDDSQSASNEGVSFEQFLRGRGEPDAASSDASEQSSIHLEPLTPSEVLEHEATEILQKGGPASPPSQDGSASEQVTAISREGSPTQEEEAEASLAEENDEAS